jgi:hypothetical protein
MSSYQNKFEYISGRVLYMRIQLNLKTETNLYRAIQENEHTQMSKKPFYRYLSMQLGWMMSSQVHKTSENRRNHVTRANIRSIIIKYKNKKV